MYFLNFYAANDDNTDSDSGIKLKKDQSETSQSENENYLKKIIISNNFLYSLI